MNTPRPARQLIRPAQSAPGTSTSISSELPLDLIEQSAGRLGWVAALFATTYAFMHLLYRTIAPLQMLPEHQILTAFSILLGAGVAAAAWSKRVTAPTMLDIGLMFQVVAALAISLGETAVPIPDGGLVRGHSAIAVWIVLFVLVVPASIGKAALAAFVTACMGPIGLAINIAIQDIPRPMPQQWVILYASSFLMVAASVTLSRFVYNLGLRSVRNHEVGSYELLDLIGEGGMGEVWRARHRLLVREAAVKLIRPERLSHTGGDFESVRLRFEREARATAALHSPYTVAVHDFGVAEDGSFYYVMELLRGLDLESFVDSFGPAPARRVVHILRQVCDSLAEAHAAGLTHRDVKPRNIFLCRLGINFDCVKVLDFGLVKIRSATEETRLTREGVTTGTPAYMAPEMALGHHNVDSRADIYATGCVAYWLLTGQLVFDATNALGMALEHVHRPPVRPSERTENEIPPMLEDIVLRCLEKDPAKRPQSARELKTLLARVDFADPWTNDLAEEWWRTHVPSAGSSVTADTSA